MAIKWQQILTYSSGGTLGAMFLLVLLLNLTGMQYTDDGNKQCTDCYSLVTINSSYWNVCAEHAGTKEVVFRKSTSPTLWVNLDKVTSIVPTKPQIATELLIPTTKAYSTINHPQYGYLRPLKDGDCFIKRPTKASPRLSKVVIHGVKTDSSIDVKWGFEIKDWLSENILIDPVWYGTSNATLEGTNLVAHYKFEGNFEDSSSQNNDGTQSGGVQIGRGVKGRGAEFDGVNDYIEKETFTGLPTNQVTVSAWVKGNLNDNWMRIVNHEWIASAGSWLLFMKNSSVTFGVYNGSQYNAIKTGTYSVDTWYHLVGVYNGTTVQVYVNGVVGTTSSVSTNLDSIGNVDVGGKTTGMFNGSIDEVRIYNTSLSATEILSLYNSNKSYFLNVKTTPTQGLVDESGLVGYWKMDSGTGSLTDSSGQGNTLTSTGATFTNEGRFKEAYKFDGINDYMLKTGFNITVNGSSTFSAWVNFAQLASAKGTLMWLYNKLYVHNGNDYYYLGGTNAYVPIVHLTNRWQHVAITYNGNTSTAKLYLNGVSNNFTTVGESISAISNLYIASSSVPSQYLNGTMDEIRIYNRTLSATEVAGLYNGSKSQFVNIKTTPELGLNNESGLVGWWTMNSGDGCTSATCPDKSGNSNTGTGSGTVLSNEGRFKEASYFSGINPSKITIANSASINITNFTISYWLRAKTLADYDAPLGKTTSSAWSAGWGFYWINATSRLNFWVQGYAGGTLAYVTLADNDFRWHHIVGQFNSTNTRMWIDGVEGTAGANTNSPFSTASLTIGEAGPAGSTQNWNGWIDEVRLYNRLLSSTEIANLYNGTKSSFFSITDVIG